MQSDDQKDPWAGKKKIWMWFPDIGAAQLKLSEVLVYCYRVYQDEYDQTPPVLKICKATGLSKQAITGADQRLIRAALLETDRTVKPPPSGWFQTKRADTIKGMQGRHWRHRYTHWEMLVRNPKTAQHLITHLQTALLSFLWHCRKTNFQPREGWSVAYLATVLRCKWESARDALERLAYLEMLDYQIGKQERLRLKLYMPSKDHLALFQDAEQQKQFRPARCTIGVGDAPAPGRPAEARPVFKTTLEDILKLVERLTEYGSEEVEEVVGRLMGKVEEDPDQLVIDLSSVKGLPLHKRRSRIEQMASNCDGQGMAS
jgi:Mn-dependent DtxR family transcriptional regulator